MLSMKQHQKYFPLFDPASREAPRRAFSSCRTSRPTDPGEHRPRQRARAARAARRTRSSSTTRTARCGSKTRVPQLAHVVYHNRLGIAARARRARAAARGAVRARARASTPRRPSAPHGSPRPISSTGMVGEFPELQGIMGRYYALHDGEPPAVADAIEAHYRPRYAGDALPGVAAWRAPSRSPTSSRRSPGFFGIGQQPTGDKDPYGLRRQALGVMRILAERELPLELSTLVDDGVRGFRRRRTSSRRRRPSSMSFFFDRMRGYFAESGLLDERDRRRARARARAHRPHPAPARSGEDVQHAARSAEPRRRQQAHRQHPQASRRSACRSSTQALLVEDAGEGARRRSSRRARTDADAALRGAGLHGHAEDARGARRARSMLSSTASW